MTIPKSKFEKLIPDCPALGVQLFNAVVCQVSMRFFRLVSAIDLLLVGAATMQAEKFWETDLCHILLIIEYYSVLPLGLLKGM